MRRSVAFRGLTMVEVLIALAILGIVVAVITTATLSSVRNTATAGGRTQATQVLNYLGRLVAGADDVLFQRESLSWDYGELGDHFQELAQEARRADPALYRAEVITGSNVTFGSVSMPLYTVTVCWMAPNGETCVTGETVGPEYDPVDPSPGPFPGIG